MRSFGWFVAVCGLSGCWLEALERADGGPWRVLDAGTPEIDAGSDAGFSCSATASGAVAGPAPSEICPKPIACGPKGCVIEWEESGADNVALESWSIVGSFPAPLSTGPLVPELNAVILSDHGTIWGGWTSPGSTLPGAAVHVDFSEVIPLETNGEATQYAVHGTAHAEADLLLPDGGTQGPPVILDVTF
jgi:hypothetical protein